MDTSILSPSDAKLYYKLLYPLLDDVNDRYHISTKTKNLEMRKGGDLSEINKIFDKLFENPEENIEHYLRKAVSRLSIEERNVLEDWKRGVKTYFMIWQFRKDGALLYNYDDKGFYIVKGLMSTWQEMFSRFKPPVVFETGILPFKGKIITNGLIIPLPYFVNSETRRQVQKMLDEAEQAGAIHTTL